MTIMFYSFKLLYEIVKNVQGNKKLRKQERLGNKCITIQIHV
jgi:hypothetical protein